MFFPHDAVETPDREQRSGNDAGVRGDCCPVPRSLPSGRGPCLHPAGAPLAGSPTGPRNRPRHPRPVCSRFVSASPILALLGTPVHLGAPRPGDSHGSAWSAARRARPPRHAPVSPHGPALASRCPSEHRLTPDGPAPIARTSCQSRLPEPIAETDCPNRLPAFDTRQSRYAWAP